MSKKIGSEQELLFKNFLQDSFAMLSASQPEILMENISKVMFTYLNIDSFTMFATDQAGKMVKIYSHNQPLPDTLKTE